MRYEVQYLVGGEEQTVVIEASDAAEAAATVQHEQGRSPESFELLSVHLMEDLESMPVEGAGMDAATVD